MHGSTLKILALTHSDSELGLLLSSHKLRGRQRGRQLVLHLGSLASTSVTAAFFGSSIGKASNRATSPSPLPPLHSQGTTPGRLRGALTAGSLSGPGPRATFGTTPLTAATLRRHVSMSGSRQWSSKVFLSGARYAATHDSEMSARCLRL